MATRLTILAWEIPRTEEFGRGPHGRVHGLQRSQIQLSTRAENAYIYVKYDA